MIAGQLKDGTRVIRSDDLPHRTMFVSADIYDLLINDGAAAKKAEAELKARAEQFSALVKKVKP